MTTAQAREVFNQAIAAMTDDEQVAKAELCREYFCNDEFRANLHNFVAEQVAA